MVNYLRGLKVEGDADHTATVGICFDTAGSEPVKAAIVAVNEPRALKIIVPPGLITGSDYHIRVETQSSAKRGASLAAVSDVPGDLIIMYSTAAGAFASDQGSADAGPNGRNSPFAEAFLKHIKNSEPFPGLLSDITLETLALPGNQQRPFQAGSILDKNYSLAGLRTNPAVPAVTPPPANTNQDAVCI